MGDDFLLVLNCNQGIFQLVLGTEIEFLVIGNSIFTGLFILFIPDSSVRPAGILAKGLEFESYIAHSVAPERGLVLGLAPVQTPHQVPILVTLRLYGLLLF